MNITDTIEEQVIVRHANMSPERLADLRKAGKSIAEDYDCETGSWYANFLAPMSEAQRYARQCAPSVTLHAV